jgi:hypothetical protein
MQVEVKYETEFGSKFSIMDIKEISKFIKRFKILSVNTINKK